MSTSLPIYQVDAFAEQAFRGNPAGVCIIPEPLEEELMQQIAAEMAVSETAFLSLDSMRLRWFTPEVEVKLCGHGTLATVHVMAETGLLSPGQQVEFQTLSGPLTARLDQSGISLDFPTPELVNLDELPPGMMEALGLIQEQICCVMGSEQKLLVELSHADQIRALDPDFSALSRLPGRGVVLTSWSDHPDLDIISRYFAPWVGINEDPVTGSAHCALARYWSDKTGRRSLIGYQASERGGRIGMRLLPGQRVLLQGNAVTTLVGKLYISSENS